MGKNQFSDNFSKRLALVMSEKDLTQDALAKTIGVAQSAVFNWLHGALPRSGELYRIAKFFGKPMEWFMQDTAPDAISQDELDTLPIGQVPADKLTSFLKEMGWTYSQWEKIIDVISSGAIEINFRKLHHPKKPRGKKKS